ncbi:MAG TPA: glycosyltransferase, partial [Chitinophagaceae bacterium]
SPYNGDFIKRHAEAAGLYDEVQVIYVGRDTEGRFTKDVLAEEFVQGQLTEKIIYYYSPKRAITLFDKIASERKYRRIYKQAVQDYINKNGKPAIVHVHVGMKAGVIALWIKRNFAVPYVVSEHWSGFLEEAKERFNDLSVYLKQQWKRVLRNASGSAVVSKYLADSIQKIFPWINPVIIPNVVNTAVFYPQPNVSDHQQFIHISGLDDLKNPKEMLQAFKIVSEKYPGIRLEIVGSRRREIVEFARDLGLSDKVSFHDEVPQPVLARHINQSLALILYSSYETFGCVVIEANACAVPVIVSDIPVFHETVKGSFNGVFAKPHDPSALAEKMMELIKNRSSFDSHAISTMTGSTYDYQTVGKLFSDWYKAILKDA